MGRYLSHWKSCRFFLLSYYNGYYISRKCMCIKVIFCLEIHKFETIFSIKCWFYYSTPWLKFYKIVIWFVWNRWYVILTIDRRKSKDQKHKKNKRFDLCTKQETKNYMIYMKIRSFWLFEYIYSRVHFALWILTSTSLRRLWIREYIQKKDLLFTPYHYIYLYSFYTFSSYIPVHG